MSNLETAKAVIKEHFDDARYGIFNCRNTVGDTMTTIYKDNNLIIDICYGWAYFEVFGLTNKEFIELANYYNQLKGEKQ